MFRPALLPTPASGFINACVCVFACFFDDDCDDCDDCDCGSDCDDDTCDPLLLFLLLLLLLLILTPLLVPLSPLSVSAVVVVVLVATADADADVDVDADTDAETDADTDAETDADTDRTGLPTSITLVALGALAVVLVFSLVFSLSTLSRQPLSNLLPTGKNSFSAEVPVSRIPRGGGDRVIYQLVYKDVGYGYY